MMHTIPRLKHGVGKQDTAHIRGSRGRVAEVAASNRQERGADTFEARAFEETHERRTPTKTKPGETRGSGDGRKRERERGRQSCGYPDPMAHAVRGTDR